MKALKTCGRAAAVLLMLACGTIQAQSLTEPEEWRARIKKAESLGALGTDLFGDSTNYYNGQPSFSATDIDLPLDFNFEVQR